MKRTIIQLTIIITATLLTISCDNNPKTNNPQTLSKTEGQSYNTSHNQIQRPSHPLQLPENLQKQQQTIESKVQSLPRHNNISYTTPTFDTTNYNERKEYLITPTDKQLVKHTGVALFIGEGSVKKPTTISITPLTEKDIENVPTNLVNLTEYHNGYRFLPDGQTFEQEIAVAMKYDTTNIPFGYGSADIFTYYYDTKSSQWEQIPRDSVDEINHIIYSRTTHFTDYINGVLKVPETSDAMAYTPTSIKDLKAAEPLNGITLMSPPQANNKGTANLSYPITVPAGRRGMQPDLNLTYNSSGGSGILGLGWDLNISSITIETRWGVPLYDPNLETETYLLDGETLVTSYYDYQSQFRLNKPAYHRELENRIVNDEDTIKQFYPRVEGGFRKILRHGTSPADYWWEVIGKDGTKYFYGSIGNSLDKGSILKSNVSNQGVTNIAKWCLKRVEDTYGNTMTYYYKLFSSDDYQLVLDKIKYTGDGQTEGYYEVKFDLCNNDKPDKSFSYRNGFKESNSRLLDKIQVLYNADTIREYYFGYKAGVFEKTLLCSVIESFEDSAKYQNYDTSEVSHGLPRSNLLLNDAFNRCDFETKGYLFFHLLYSFNYNELPNNTILGSSSYNFEYTDNDDDDNLAYFILPVDEKKNFSASESFSWNVGGGLDVGLGWELWSKSISLGGNYLYNKEESEGLITLVDLNGDGYVDKLIRDDDGDDVLKYRLRIVDGSNIVKFGELTTLNKSSFQYSESSTDNWGAEGQLKIGSVGGGFGLNWSNARTTTSVYLSDVNADGMVDIIDNGKVYINQFNRDTVVSFLDVTEYDTIWVGGNCGDEYVYNETEVDSSLFGSGWKYFEREVCVNHPVGVPDTTTEHILVGFDIDSTVTGTITDSTFGETVQDSILISNIAVVYQDSTLIDIYIDSTLISFNVTPYADTIIYKKFDKIREVDTLIYNPKTGKYESTIYYDTIWSYSTTINIRYDTSYVYDYDTTYTYSYYNRYDTVFIYEPYTRFIYEYSTRNIYRYDTTYNYNDVTSYHTWTIGDSCYIVIDSFYYEFPERYEPNIDLVRMWKAPYSGVVSISGIAKLSEDFDTLRLMSNVNDGVALSIQKGGEPFLRLFRSITPNQNNREMNIDTLSVNAGDRLYFRMNSMDTRKYDKVRWNPIIQYTSAKYRDDQPYLEERLNDIDANGDSIFRFSYSDDYMPNGIQKVGAPFNSRFNVNVKLNSTEPLLDDLELTIKKGIIYKDSVHREYNDDNVLCILGDFVTDIFGMDDNTDTKDIVLFNEVPSVLKTYTFPKGTILNINIDTLIDMQQKYVYNNRSYDDLDTYCFDYSGRESYGAENLYFELSTPNRRSQIKWADIDAKATIIVDSSYDDNYTYDNLYDTINDKFNLVYYPAINKKNYDYAIVANEPWVSPVTTTNGFSVITNISVPLPFTYNLYMTIKDNDGVLAYRGNVDNSDLNTFSNLNLIAGKTYYIDYYTDKSSARLINNIKSRVIANNTAYIINSGLYVDYDDNYHRKFGEMYRGWGQFGYKVKSTADTIINESYLVLDSSIYTNDTANLLPASTPTIVDTNNVINNPEMEIDGIYNPLLDRFFVMNVDNKYNSWVGYGNIIYATKEFIGHTKVNEMNDSVLDLTLSPMPQRLPQEKIKAVNKEVENNGFSVTGGVSCFIFSAGGSYSKGETNLLGDYMDMNGDRYPDALSETSIKYSKSRGGLSDLTKSFSGQIDKTKYSSWGATAGATFLKMKFELGNDPKKAKAIISGEAGLNAGYSHSNSETRSTLTDVNGDGLPDQVFENGEVRFNRGYGFTSSSNYNLSSVRMSSSNSYTAGLGAGSGLSINRSETSIALGLGGSLSDNKSTYSLVDVNGDGLSDIVKDDGSIMFNRGESFTQPSATVLGITESIDQSQTLNADGSIAFTIGSTIGPWPVKIVINPKGGMAWSKTQTYSQWIDINNDGYSDYVYKDGDRLKVRYSQIGKANLLKSVNTILGSEYKIDYSLSQSSNECPQRYWNMSSLKVYDGYSGDGQDTIYSTFEYGKKFYSRYERDEYGYDTVITKEYLNNQVYRVKKQAYHYDNFMFKGLIKYDVVTDNSGNKYVENIYDYQPAQIKTGAYIPLEIPAHCMGDVYPALAHEQTLYYEGQSLAGVHTEKYYYYTLFGNVSNYIDKGNTAVSNDNIQSFISYKYDTTDNKYLVSLVDTITITDENGNLFRKRSAEYTAEGSLSKLIMYNNNYNSVYEYKYDSYGNIDTVFMPENINNQRMKIIYNYDNAVHIYPVQVRNSLGYSSYATYNYRWGKPLITTDIAGNQMRYTYDEKGRTKTITGPKEIGTGHYTIKYEYWDRQKYEVAFNSYLILKALLWATTYHYDPEYPTNDIITMTHCDGLGRVIQIRKDIEVGGLENNIVSGWVCYDGLGRKIKQYQSNNYTPFNTPSVNQSLYAPNSYGLNIFVDTTKNTNPPTTITYDLLDRPLLTTYPDGTTTINGYSLNSNNFLTQITDQNGNNTTIHSDHRQQKTKITDANNFITTFQYDALGQLTSSVDPETNSTGYEYDMAGRRISRTHPSSGLTTWGYDRAGNMTAQTMSSGESIHYNYNYNQLTNVTYSDRSWNDVWYEYGGAGSGNETGRLVKQQDATGVQEFGYGNMGELIYNLHSYVVPNSSDAFSLTTRWDYDSWNRIKTITYPDGEDVRYSYNKGGLLKSIQGDKNGAISDYIKRIDYNEYEQRINVYNGYNTETHYKYDPLMLRMTNLITTNPNGNILELNYGYDGVGNITKIDNVGLNPYHQEYSYDATNRLNTASGNWYNNNQINYDLSMNYSPCGRILSKTLGGNKYDNSNIPISMDKDFAYDYNTNNPYSVDHIYDGVNGKDEYFNWDVKGNMIIHQSPQWNDDKRYLCWTEDNRLQAVKDPNMGAYYNYDASGERNLKLTGSVVNVTQNGTSTYIPFLEQQTLYASALVTVNDKGYTKHYFEDGKRICSKIGSGYLQGVSNLSTPIEGDYQIIRDQISLKGVIETFGKCMDQEVAIKTQDLFKEIIQPYESQVNQDEPVFYYHSDHLGSASYITDDNGNETQHLVYLPFGEDWVDLKYNTSQFETPFKFNGKEKDTETGYNNYGARYYSDYLSIFLSVDPMSDKYPHLSSYAYCANNPIMLIDPDGRDIEYYNLYGNKVYTKETKDVKKMLVVSYNKEVNFDKDKMIDVASVDLNAMDEIYKNSDADNNERGYTVREDNTHTDIQIGDNKNVSLLFPEKSQYTLHSHCKNQLDENGETYTYGKTFPSEDYDLKNFGGSAEIGVILGYKNKDKKVSLGSSFGQSSYDPKNLVRSVGFFEKNGKVTNIDYDKFISAIKKIQNE